jgi:hypothetical protein
MNTKTRLILAFLMLSLLTMGCLGSFWVPGSIFNNWVPTYPGAKTVKVSTDDLEFLVEDVLAEGLGYDEVLDYRNKTSLTYSTDSGSRVQDKLDDLLSKKKYRILDDWSEYGTITSEWRKGTLHVAVMIIDDLDRDAVKELGKRYGITGVDSGSTLILIHGWDTGERLR